MRSPPRGFHTFGFAANEHLDLYWRGKRVGPAHLLVFPPGQPLESVSLPGFQMFAFSVSEEALEEAALRKGLLSSRKLLPATDLLICPERNMNQVRSSAKLLSRSFALCPLLLGNRSFAESLEIDLVDHLIDAIAAARSIQKPQETAKSRRRAVKAARDLIADRADEPIQISEILKVTGVNGRTLRYAFEEVYGLSPKQYLQAYRLNNVRIQLREARQRGLNISDVANEWGFWHIGQFAHDYRKMFGERPRDTFGKP